MKFDFLRSLYRRGVVDILSANLLSRLVVFLTTTLVVRMTSTSEFALYAYSASIIGFLIPLGGMGLQNGLIYFGGRERGYLRRQAMFVRTLLLGVSYSMVLVILLALLGPYICANLPAALQVFIVLSTQLISQFLLGELFAYLRVLHLNKLYSRLYASASILQLILALVLTHFLGILGFALSFFVYQILAFISFVVIFRDHGIFEVRWKELFSGMRKAIQLKYHLYSISTGLSNVLAILIFSVDIILLANVMEGGDIIAVYKVAGLIPFNLVILPVVIFTTDFVKLSRWSAVEPGQIMRYYISYLKNFSLLFALIVLVLFIAAPWVLWLFGEEYQAGLVFFRVFLVGIFGALLLRVPLGNILATVGWSHVNLMIAAGILLLNLICNYFAILRYGAIGAAVVTSSLLWFSGIANLAALQYWRRLHER